MIREATWFQMTAQPNFSRILLTVRGKPNLRFLQIGVYKGDASEWMLKHILTGDGSTLTEVDPWGETDYHELDALDPDWDAIYDEYRKRTAPYHYRIREYRCTSNNFFTGDFRHWAADYDFIYIDGAHDAVSTLEDGIHAYRHLRKGGMLAFDDYTYATDDNDPLKSPALAIDTIRTVYKDRLVPIVINSQVWFRKVA